YFHPGAFGQFHGADFHCEGKPRARFLTGQRHDNGRFGSAVEFIHAQDQDGALAGLFASACRVQISPPEFAPQYSGHGTPPSPNSVANARSSLGLSLASSRRNRARRSTHVSCLIAAATALLRLGNRPSRTSLSTLANSGSSMVMAIFSVLM